MAWAEIARAVLGIGVFIALAWLISERRRDFPFKPVLIGLASQFVLALLLTRLPAVTELFGWIAHGVDRIQASSLIGARFAFGYLSGGPQPFELAQPAVSTVIFAFQGIPAVLFVSALAALLWHWKILRWIVSGAARLFGRLFGVSGPVGVSTSACIFIGMIEAPLLIRPILPTLSRGEIFIIMVDGMSVLAGSMMILLGTMLAQQLPNAFGHLLMAALISTPMAIGLARAIIPTEAPPPGERVVLENPYRSSLDAIAHGTLAAAKMAVSIIALVIVFVGLVALIDQLLALLPHEGTPITLAYILGHLLAPVAWLMGVPSGDVHAVASLLGTKIALNEIVAYGQLAALAPDAISEKGLLIVTYALSSFANVGSVAILIGALSAIAPARTEEITQLGFKALAAALLTTCLTATTVGMLSSIFI